jgi:hypothetical protein
MGKFARIEVDKVEHFLDAGGDARGIPFSQSGNQRDVFRDRKVGEKTGVLDDVADASAEADEIPIASGALLDKDFPPGGQ